MSSILARSNIFVEIDHEIISMVSVLRRVVVSYKRKYVHEVLVNHLVKLAQEKIVVRLTDCLDMTILVDWDVTHEPTKQTPLDEESRRQQS